MRPAVAPEIAAVVCASKYVPCAALSTLPDAVPECAYVLSRTTPAFQFSELDSKLPLTGRFVTTAAFCAPLAEAVKAIESRAASRRRRRILLLSGRVTLC